MSGSLPFGGCRELRSRPRAELPQKQWAAGKAGGLCLPAAARGRGGVGRAARLAKIAWASRQRGK
eukprot:5327510-Pyramimonas_sp.AAC.1